MTDEEARAVAKEIYNRGAHLDDVEVALDAKVIHLTEEGSTKGAAWVQVWVYVPPQEAT